MSWKCSSHENVFVPNKNYIHKIIYGFKKIFSSENDFNFLKSFSGCKIARPAIDMLGRKYL